MEELKVKYLQGWLTSENMYDENYWNNWEIKVGHAEADNATLVVFKIPNQTFFRAMSGEMIAKIEKLLQDEYGK